MRDHAQDFHVKVTVDPSNVPLKPKQPVSVTFVGSNSKVITSGSVTYKVYADGHFIHGATDPLCDFISCPIAKGSGTRTLKFDLPWWLPAGKYSGYSTIKDQDGDLVLCSRGYTYVKGKAPPAPKPTPAPAPKPGKCPCPNCPGKGGKGACCHWTQPGPAPASACETQNWSRKTCTPAYGTWCPASKNPYTKITQCDAKDHPSITATIARQYFQNTVVDLSALHCTCGMDSHSGRVLCIFL